MDISSIVHYLGTLLGRPLTTDTALRLSSAPRARFKVWLHGQGVKRNDKLLAGEFTIAQLITGETAAPVAPASVTAPGSAFANEHSGIPSSALSLGVDMQSVDELMAGVNRSDFKADPTLAGIFTARELSYAQSCADPAETLTGLFAAKEAIRKCLGGPPISADAFQAIEILPDEHGRPTTGGHAISISHSGGFAVAIACRNTSMQAKALSSSPPTRVAIETARHINSAKRRIGIPMLIVVVALILIYAYTYTKALSGR